jgi:integrase
MSETAMRIASETARPLPRRVNFTVETLKAAVTPPGKSRSIVYDARTPGLALRVTNNGAKSFVFYRKVDGRPLLMKLGGFPDITIEQARTLASKVNGQVAEGKDPMEDRRAVRTSDTIQQLFDRWKKENAELRLSPRTIISDESRFRTCFADWTARKIASIKASHVKDKHAEIARKRGKVTANRAVQLLRRLCNWANVTPNPASKSVTFFQETERERFMEAEEIPRFFTALEAEINVTVRDYVKLSLWTGARRSNVQSMRWDEINFGTSTWTVPASKSKSGEAMKLHLSPPALAVLESRKGNGSDYVLPGDGKSGHLVEPKAAWKRILETAQISDLRLHDLRRTLGSWQAATGASLPVIGKSLGHHDAATTQIYARLNLDPVRASVNTAAAAILAVVNPPEPEKPKTKTNTKTKRNSRAKK